MIMIRGDVPAAGWGPGLKEGQHNYFSATRFIV